MSLTKSTGSASLGGNWGLVYDGKTTQIPFSFGSGSELLTGTGANQADEVVVSTGRVLATASETFNLSGDANLLNPKGEQVTFARIKQLYIQLVTGDANLEIGGDAQAWLFLKDATDIAVLLVGSTYYCDWPDATGRPVVATTGDKLRVNALGNATYNIGIVGATA